MMNAIGVQCLSTSAVGTAAAVGVHRHIFRRHDESTTASDRTVASTFTVGTGLVSSLG